MSDMGCVKPSGCAKEFEGYCYSSRDCKYQRMMIECRHCRYKYPYEGRVFDYCPHCGKAYAAELPEEPIDIRF